LCAGNKYRATSDATPYANPIFIKLLFSAYAGLVPRNTPANAKITWLGRGHVAFADIMVRCSHHVALISLCLQLHA
jgi:hypothetical protein